MRLTDLKPKWLTPSQYTLPGGVMVFPRWSEDINRTGCGISFQDPTKPNQRIGVFFVNPIGGLPPADHHKLWERTGETFDTLTLSPSIDTSSTGGWHGFITNGEVTP